MLTVGEARTFEGTYIAHWEVSRFELPAVPAPRRWFRWLSPRVDSCELETAPGIATLRDTLFGDDWSPAAWLSSPGKTFAMRFDGTVLEHGSFGHMGWCTWRVRVDTWLSVVELPTRGALPTARVRS